MRFERLALVVLTTICIAKPALATGEICGNGIDDDGNGLTDEGCYPTLTTGVCESPLSCGDTGIVSWATGSLHYDLPPDIAPAVPYGPGIGFRRFYTSMYTPGSNPTTVNKTPLGPHWQHTYMTWLYAFNDGTTNRIVLHTSQGRDVLYTDAGACGSYECYTPQAGEHVMSLKVDTTDPNNPIYYVQLLTGDTLKYNSYGQIIEIWDTMPTPNKVLITWDSTTNGNVSTVTDASGERRLSFSYTNNLLTSINYQLYDSSKSQWVTKHTTLYDYTNGITRDSTSQWFVPQGSTEWTKLLQGTDIPNPTNQWNCQDTSGNLADSISTTALTAVNNGGMSYSQTVSGWSRKAVTLTAGSTSYWASGTGFCNPKTTKCTAFGIVQAAEPASGTTLDVFGLGDSNGLRGSVHGNVLGFFSYNSPEEFWDGTSNSNGSYRGTFLQPWITSADPVNDFTSTRVGAGISITPTWATGTSASGTFTMGKLSNNSAAAAYLYMAAWSGTALTNAQQLTVVNRIMNGAGLSSVTIGGNLAQQYTYDDSGYLTKIADADSKQIAAFSYSSSNAGEVDRIATSRGNVGFEYDSTRTACSGETALYFNLGSTTSCSTDSDCGSGYMCGGKTGSGSTGACFLAGRCLTTSSVNGESVITSVAPLGAGGGSCSGACTDAMGYVWTGTGTGNINPIGTEDPLTHYTSATYNSNGLPTQIGYGDTNSDPTDGGTNRTEWLFYDSTYPGRIAEIRRPSDLASNASSCSATSTTGCVRTRYCYGSSCSASCSNDNQLCTIEQDGYTLDSTGAIVSYANTITYVHDSVGRISEIDGAVSGIKTVFEYNGSGVDATSDNFLKDSKIYTDSTNYVEPQLTTYDFWGHPTSLEAPDGNFTCDTYDTARGYLTSRRRAMNGQSNCTSAQSGDLTTNWLRDSWLRLTRLTRPDGSYLVYTYDSSGRPSETQRSDDDKNAADHQVFSYGGSGSGCASTSLDHLCTVETYNAGGTETGEQQYTYYASGRLEEIINPDSPTDFTGIIYDDAGKVTEVDGAGSLAKTLDHFDGAAGRDNRVTSVQRYNSGSASDTWSLLYAWMGAQSQVTDPDSKLTGSTRDDLGRLVEIASPDLGDPTVRVYDAAGRLTTIVEDLGGGSARTHTFTYDAMGRRLNDDYAGRCSTSGTNHPWIQRSYDGLPSGVSCPMTGGCNFTRGRLAYVETVLMCSSTYDSTDGSLDQFTWYSYDPAGHLTEEYTTDDTGRVADTAYQYINGALAQVTTPSDAVIGWSYDSNTSNSDKDRVTSVWEGNSSTPVIDTVRWFPYGGWEQYNWEASIAGTPLDSKTTRNLAGLITAVYNAEQGSTENAEVAIGRDLMERVTSRVYTPHDPTVSGLFDSYYLYDEQSRVLCETTDSQTSCPTTGSDIKNSHDMSPPFTGAGDWKEILRPIAGSSGGLTNNFNSSGTYPTTHQVTDVNQSDGTPSFGHTAMAYDAFGERSYDDNTTTLTNDRRDYTYDARHNLVNVRGQYYTGSAWHYYDVTSAYDHKNRRVFKSFYDETSTKTAEWFFYYDVFDRLTEVKYTPDTVNPNTHTFFQLFWLENRLVMYQQTDWNAGVGTTSKRYVATDETGRPIQLWNWPSSGDATRVWVINPSAWGFDTNVLGASIYQPILFAGQYEDVETAAYENDGATMHRPGLVANGARTYDPFAGGYLQLDPLDEYTWSAYTYADSDPVGRTDATGLEDNGIGAGTSGDSGDSFSPACDGVGGGYLPDSDDIGGLNEIFGMDGAEAYTLGDGNCNQQPPQQQPPPMCPGGTPPPCGQPGGGGSTPSDADCIQWCEACWGQVQLQCFPHDGPLPIWKQGGFGCLVLLQEEDFQYESSCTTQCQINHVGGYFGFDPTGDTTFPPLDCPASPGIPTVPDPTYPI